MLYPVLEPGFGHRSYPFKDPIITPFTKYFCKNGYARTIGKAVITIVVKRTDVELIPNVETKADAFEFTLAD